MSSNQIRTQIIQAIDILIENQENQEKANQILNSLYHKFSEEDQYFYLDSIVFMPFVQLARTSYFQRETSSLLHIKKQLLGEHLYTNIYAYKHNFSDILSENTSKTYQTLKKFLTMRLDLTEMFSHVDEFSQDYQDIRSELITSCDDLLPNTLPNLLVINAVESLIKVSYIRSEEFDIIDRFSSTAPTSSVENLKLYLAYIEHLVQKIEGEEVLFVDVHLLSSGFVVNLR